MSLLIFLHTWHCKKVLDCVLWIFNNGSIAKGSRAHPVNVILFERLQNECIWKALLPSSYHIVFILPIFLRGDASGRAERGKSCWVVYMAYFCMFVWHLFVCFLDCAHMKENYRKREVGAKTHPIDYQFWHELPQMWGESSLTVCFWVGITH